LRGVDLVMVQIRVLVKQQRTDHHIKMVINGLNIIMKERI